MRKPVEPLLVVKQSPHDACRRVLVAVDFSPSSLLAASLLGSVTRHVLQESQGDVLVSPAPPLLDERAG